MARWSPHPQRVEILAGLRVPHRGARRRMGPAPMGELVESAFLKKGLKLQAPMPTNYLETIKMMVSVGLGWSMLPQSMVNSSDSQICIIPWPGPAIKRSLGLIRLKERTLSNAAQALIDLLNMQ